MKDVRGKTVVKSRLSHERAAWMCLMPERSTPEQKAIAVADAIKAKAAIPPGTCYNLEAVRLK